MSDSRALLDVPSAAARLNLSVSKVSLGIREFSDGKVLVRCYAGCSTEHVLEALGLTCKDLYPR